MTASPKSLSSRFPPRLIDDPDFCQWISAERFSAAFSFSSVKSGLRAISRIGVSRRPQSSAASGIFAAMSIGITIAPCWSAWMRSSE